MQNFRSENLGRAAQQQHVSTWSDLSPHPVTFPPFSDAETQAPADTTPTCEAAAGVHDGGWPEAGPGADSISSDGERKRVACSITKPKYKKKKESGSVPCGAKTGTSTVCVRAVVESATPRPDSPRHNAAAAVHAPTLVCGVAPRLSPRSWCFYFRAPKVWSRFDFEIMLL